MLALLSVVVAASSSGSSFQRGEHVFGELDGLGLGWFEAGGDSAPVVPAVQAKAKSLELPVDEPSADPQSLERLLAALRITLTQNGVSQTTALLEQLRLTEQQAVQELPAPMPLTENQRRRLEAYKQNGKIEECKCILVANLKVEAQGYDNAEALKFTATADGDVVIPEGTVFTTGDRTQNLAVYTPTGLRRHCRKGDVFYLHAMCCDPSHAVPRGPAQPTPYRVSRSMQGFDQRGFWDFMKHNVDAPAGTAQTARQHFEERQFHPPARGDTGVVEETASRVTREGGRAALTGGIQISLAWDNHDDLDLHCETPSGKEISYLQKHVDGGMLDVDMNAKDERGLLGTKLSNRAVENIVWERNAPHGRYRVFVQNYYRRLDQRTCPYRLTIRVNGHARVFHGETRGSREASNVYYTFTYRGGSDFPSVHDSYTML